MKYRLLVSHNCGASYSCEKESENLAELLKEGHRCEADALRWVIEDEIGDTVAVCGIIKNIAKSLKKLNEIEGEDKHGS
jgi:hypothetical protein